jgi:MFS family permease
VSAFQPLRRNRDFVLLMSGRLLSGLGSGMTNIAYPLLVLSATHSPAKAGLVGFLAAVTRPLLSIPAGLWADAADRKRLMIGADVVRALAIGALVALIVADVLAFWQIALVAFVEGAASVLFLTAQPGALQSVVPAEQMPAAISVMTGRQAVISLSSPPVGGALFEVGRSLPFLVDFLSYAFSFLSLAAMRTPFQKARERDVAPVRERLAEGFRFLWSRPFLRATSLLWAFANFTGPGLFLALVVIGRRQGLTGGEIGLLSATFGAALFVGSLLGSTVRRLFSVRVILLLEFWCWILCGLFLVWPSVYVLAATMVPVGIAIPNTDSVVDGYRIAITPEHLLGRSEAVRTTLAVAVLPLGPLAAGLLLEHVSERWTIAVFTLFNLALAVTGTLSRAIRDAPSLGELKAQPS